MIFIFLSVLTYSIQNVANKEAGRRFGDNKGSAWIQDTLIVFFAALIMLCTGNFAIPAPKYLLTAAFFGCVYIATIFMLILGMKIGTIGDTTIMVNLGLFFSSLFGIFRYGDKVTLFTGIGVICMLAVILLSVPSKSERKENSNRLKWFFVALSAAIMNSSLAITKRIVSDWNISGAAETIEMKNFLFWSFSFSTLCGLLIVAINRPPKSTFKTLFTHKNCAVTLILSALAGMGSSCGNLFQMMAISNGVSSAIVYPVCAGSLITVAWLISVLYYKEIKVNIRSLISLILCIAGIVLVQIK